jgi:hypothetical protein
MVIILRMKAWSIAARGWGVSRPPRHEALESLWDHPDEPGKTGDEHAEGLAWRGVQRQDGVGDRCTSSPFSWL